MSAETVDVFIPNAGVGGSPECTVIACGAEPGGEVIAGEVLARLRSGQVDLGVEAPLSGTLVTLHARDGARMRVGDLLAQIVPGAPRAARSVRPRSASSQTLVARAPLGVAVAIAAAALAWPVAVLVVSVLTGVVIAGLRDTQRHEGVTGSADVVVAPLRLLRSIARVGAKRASSLSAIVGGVVRLGLWITLALVLPAVLGALAWLATESKDGLLAAMRMAAYGYGLPLFAAIASFWILRRALDFEAVTAPLRSLLERLPEAALSCAVVAGIGWIAACAVLIPSHAWAPASSLQGVVQALPSGLRDSINELRSSIVAAEARRVVDCLWRHDRPGWREPRAFVAGDGTLIVGVRPERAPAPGRRAFGVLVLALQNQLVNTRADVSVVAQPGANAVTFDTFQANRPVTDVGRILERLTVAGSSVPRLPTPSQIRPVDVAVALTCSAAAV